MRGEIKDWQREEERKKQCLIQSFDQLTRFVNDLKLPENWILKTVVDEFHHAGPRKSLLVCAEGHNARWQRS